MDPCKICSQCSEPSPQTTVAWLEGNHVNQAPNTGDRGMVVVIRVMTGVIDMSVREILAIFFIYRYPLVSDSIFLLAL